MSSQRISRGFQGGKTIEGLSATAPVPRVLVSDGYFTHALVEAREVPGKGRGILALQNIQDKDQRRHRRGAYDGRGAADSNEHRQAAGAAKTIVRAAQCYVRSHS